MIRIPTWLLRTFGSGPSIETWIGDLTEEYHEGRSAVWFWGQAMMAIPTTFITEVWAHRLLTFRALAMGWMLVTGLSWVVRELLPWIKVAMKVYLPPHERSLATAYRYIDGVRVGNPETVSADWQQFVAMPFVRIVLFGLTYLATGWVVARLHRKHLNPAVFSLVFAFLISTLISVAWVTMFPPQQLRFWDVRRLEPIWWNTWAVTFGVNLIALMVGGLAVGSRKTEQLAPATEN